MELVNAINTITWPAAFAIVGSLTTIVVGIFGYLINANRIKAQQQAPALVRTTSLQDDLKLIHSRVSDTKNRTASLEGDVKLLFGKWETLAKQIDDHDSRDIDDFKKLDQKVDKLTEVIMKMLQDEKL